MATSPKDAAVATLHDIIQRRGLFHGDFHLITADQTPRVMEKVRNAIKAYGNADGGNIRFEDVVFLYDGTVFGSAADGFLLTPTTLAYHNMWEQSHALPLRSMKNIITNDAKNCVTVEMVPGTAAKPSYNITVLASEFRAKLTSVLKEFRVEMAGAVDGSRTMPAVLPTLPAVTPGAKVPYETAFSILQTVVAEIGLNDDNVYLGPVKDKKRRNAAEKYGEDLLKWEDIVLLYDNTVFGSARDGFAMSASHVAYNNMAGRADCMTLASIKTVVKGESSLKVTTSTGSVHTINLNLSKAGGSVWVQLPRIITTFRDRITGLLKPGSGDVGGAAPAPAPASSPGADVGSGSGASAGAGAGSAPPAPADMSPMSGFDWKKEFDTASTSEEIIRTFEVMNAAASQGLATYPKLEVIDASTRKRAADPEVWNKVVARHFGTLLLTLSKDQ